MPTLLSKDRRKRILAAKASGRSPAQVAKELPVGVSAVPRLLALHGETGGYQARPLRNGRKTKFNETLLQAIGERMEIQPDITLREPIDELVLPVSETALCKTLNGKLKLCVKKRHMRQNRSERT